jgi:phosphoribosylformimino-5-aminoimidazole carboxamide ribotide isomerase
LRIEIIPAIDLKQGRCVRLYQGDYAAETVFSEEPAEVALQWQALGAPRLHVVDLDGAISGELHNLDIITEIAKLILIPTQLGGGIRHLGTVEQVLKIGIDRVILGTAAAEDTELITRACQKFRDSVVVAIDARDGLVATRGWQRQTELPAVELARTMVKLGVRRFLYTDINRDGTLTEPNFTAIAELVDAVRQPVIAAGGISSVTHIKMLKQLGVEGAIIGKALYTGDIDLKQAIDDINQVYRE